LYEAGGRPILTEIEPPAVDRPEPALSAWTPRLAASANVFFTGDGAVRYREIIERSVPDARIVAPVPPLAGAIAELAREARLRGEAVAPHGVRPLYVRRPDAELARSKRS
jgi:tRNA A37 threonylcarbamoyladenosine modification protein TsaB